MKDTRNKLLRTALKMFSQHGLKGVSTRDLAKEAGVNLCSISYYFGSKEKLYDAVVEEVVMHFKSAYTEKVMLELQKLKLPPCEEIKYLIGRFFDAICSREMSDMEAGLLLKELISPTDAYEKFYNIVFEPLHKHISDMLIKLFAISESTAIIRTHLLFGQAVLFRLGKVGLLRRLHKKSYTPELLAEIRENLLRSCDTILNTMED